MKAPVPFTVHLQALGGKFLGPNAFDNPSIKLELDYSMGRIPIPYKVIPGTTDDGAISTSFTNGVTSFLPILTMPLSGTGNPVVNYLSPGAHTIAGRVNIFLPDNNEIAMLHASIPAPSGVPFVFSQPVLLCPRQTVYTVTMVIPGLLLTPNTNTVLPPGTIAVNVAMMCGCKIINKPDWYWTYTDFDVHAMVTYQDGTGALVNLSFDQQVNLSLFTAPVTNYSTIREVNFWATQKSTANYGALRQTF